MRSRFIAVVLLGAAGLWLLADGIAAMATGEYLLGDGAWAGTVAAVGFEPEGWPMRFIHVGVGVVALVAAFAIAAGWGALAWWIGVAASLLVLWYVPLGTIAGAVSLLVLLLPGPRLAIRGH
ncbi:MAG: hypothetical protein AB1Z57_08625 [Acidimicrobiia bacterium]